MPPKVIEITEAVKDELNGQGFSQAFTAEWAHLPVFELPDFKMLHVTVVPKAIRTTAGSRSVSRRDYDVGIAVQKRFSGALNQSELDALMKLIQEIASFLRSRRLTGCDDVAWVTAQSEPIFAPDHIEQMGQFTSVLTVTYRRVA